MNSKSEKIITETNVIQMKNCEEALSYIYSDGKYQKFAMLLLTICYTCTGAFITNSLIFLQKDPKIECFFNNSIGNLDPNFNDQVIPKPVGNKDLNEPIEFNDLYNITKTFCSRKEACDKSNKNLISYNFLFESQKYYSWVNDLKIGCDRNHVIGLFSSIFFMGGLISSLISTCFSDYFGRAKLIKLSMMIRSVFILSIILFPSEKMIMLSMFFLGLLNSMHSTIPYILLSEYMKKENRDDYLTYMFIFESFSGILGTFFFLLIQNWLLFLILNLLFGLIFIYYSEYLYESPRYLYSKNLYSETKEVLEKISLFNLGYAVKITFEKEINESLQNPNNENVNKTENKKEFFREFLEIFQSEKYRLYIIVMPLVWFLDAFAFYAIYFMIKYIDNNLYLMNIILFVSEAVSYNVSGYIVKIYGKRDTMIYSFILSAVSFIMFYLLSQSSFITLLLIFSAKFGAAVILNISSIYTNECFPTSIRGRCTAICSFLGKFGGIISPMLVEMTKNTSIVSSLFCFFAAGILIPLKNSNNQIEFEDNDFNKIKEENITEDKQNFLDKCKISDFKDNFLISEKEGNGKVKSRMLLEMIQKDKEGIPLKDLKRNEKDFGDKKFTELNIK